jgi:hypothetical protein
MSLFTGEILALDLSAKRTGVAEGRPGEQPRLYSAPFHAKDDDHRAVFGKALKWLGERMKVSVPAVIAIEGRINTAWGHTNADTTLLLCGLWGLTAAASWNKGTAWRAPKVHEVRKHFIAHGGALAGEIAKDLVGQRCRELGWSPPNHDSADAAAVWHWTLAQYRPDLAAPAPTNWWKSRVPQKGMTWGNA